MHLLRTTSVEARRSNPYPLPVMAYPSLILRSGRDRSLIRRHPWLFSGAIKKRPEAEQGSIVAVRNNHNALLGYGFYNPKSQIVCRLFTFTDEEQTFDGPAFWQAKVERAWALRQAHLPAETTCFRLLHAEGDFFPGVIADVYGDVVVVQLLIKGTERLYPHLLHAFDALGFKHVWLKNKKGPKQKEAVALPNGWLSETTTENTTRTVSEHGMRFAVDFETGQKTGFFLDQRDNRALLQQYSSGKRVLNAFSYTGGFSVYALAGGASAVDSVDVSAPAIAQAEHNVRLNYPDAPHQAIAADCFRFLRQSGDPYDLIVLDPPAFAKNARTVPNAARGYKDLNLNAFRRLAPGGLLFTFSCSQNIDRDLFRKIVFGAAVDAGRRVRILHQLTQPFDHPINIYHPEGEYLKGLVLYVE